MVMETENRKMNCVLHDFKIFVRKDTSIPCLISQSLRKGNDRLVELVDARDRLVQLTHFGYEGNEAEKQPTQGHRQVVVLKPNHRSL